MSTLSKKRISELRSQAHTLSPGISLGKQGLTPGFRNKLEQLLHENQLLKIKVGRKVELDWEQVAREFKATLIQRVGRTATLYRPNPDK